MNTPVRINLGCGSDIRPGWVNVDIAPIEGVNVVHDLRQLPLPFASDSASEIICYDVLEHLDYPPLLKECWRVLQPGGRLHICVPHFTAFNNFCDPTHIRRFSIRTFNFFARDTFEGKFRSYYFDFRFSSAQSRRISFNKSVPMFYNYLAEWAVNLHPKIQNYYEATGLCYLFPAANIRLDLVK